MKLRRARRADYTTNSKLFKLLVVISEIICIIRKNYLRNSDECIFQITRSADGYNAICGLLRFNLLDNVALIGFDTMFFSAVQRCMLLSCKHILNVLFKTSVSLVLRKTISVAFSLCTFLNSSSRVSYFVHSTRAFCTSAPLDAMLLNLSCTDSVKKMLQLNCSTTFLIYCFAPPLKTIREQRTLSHFALIYQDHSAVQFLVP